MHNFARTVPTLVALAAATLLAGRAGAVTQIDCDTPDDFCTGDPCITSDVLEITVASCVLDFSPRTLQIDDLVLAPNNGTLSLTAGQIIVNRRIDGQHITSTEPDGTDITLSASGAIVNNGRIQASGRASAGTITLNAGGQVTLDGQLRSRARGSSATTTGGTINVVSAAAIVGTKRGKIDVRGRKSNTAGGQLNITAQADVSLDAKVDARGYPGGGITLASTGGDVVTDDSLRAQGWPDAGGGTVSITAADEVAVDSANVTGSVSGGGTITVQAGVATLERLNARGFAGAVGGSIGVVAGTVNVIRGLDVRGSGGGGTIDIESTVGDVTLRHIDAQASSGAGGTVTIDAAADFEISGDVEVDGDVGGEIRISAGGNANLGLSASGGDIDATGAPGGIIEVLAGGDLTAVGDYEAETGGCIGLSAGGTLDTSAASFDVPLSGSCP